MMKQNIRNNQQGFVSIVVAVILIAIISLITLGFAFTVRQNQRNSLNRQLSTQAFYAAESGVNDAMKRIADHGDITECSDTPAVAFMAGNSQDLDSSGNVRYTCVLIDQSPDNLIYDSISTSNSTMVRVQTSAPIASIRLSWQDAGGGNTFGAASTAFPLPNNPTASGTCSSPCNTNIAQFPNRTGMLRTTIVPASAATSTDDLLNSAQTIFMYPSSGGSNNSGVSVPFRTAGNMAQDGIFAAGQCRTSNPTPRYCNVNIDVSGTGGNDFFLRLKAVYKNVNVVVQAFDSNGVVLPISGSQAMIDSTGKASDVVRRIQVRVPITPGYYFPEFAIETNNTMCKRTAVWNGGAGVVAPEVALGLTNDGTKDARACQIPGQTAPVFPY